MKIRQTPESAEVLGIRCEYDREVYELRKEISVLRSQLDRRGSNGELAVAFVLGLLVGIAAVFAWMVLS